MEVSGQLNASVVLPPVRSLVPVEWAPEAVLFRLLLYNNTLKWLYYFKGDPLYKHSWIILIIGVRLTSHWTAAAFTGLLFVPGWEWMSEITIFFNFRKFRAHGGMILTGETRRTRRKTCPSDTLSTTYPTGLTQTRTRAAAVRQLNDTTVISFLRSQPLFYNSLADHKLYNCFKCYCTYMGKFGPDEENLLPMSRNAPSCCEYPTES
jgi:hypothetical protein